MSWSIDIYGGYNDLPLTSGSYEGEYSAPTLVDLNTFGVTYTYKSDILISGMFPVPRLEGDKQVYLGNYSSQKNIQFLDFNVKLLPRNINDYSTQTNPLFSIYDLAVLNLPHLWIYSEDYPLLKWYWDRATKKRCLPATCTGMSVEESSPFKIISFNLTMKIPLYNY